jgi:hypothetical protein
LARWPASVFIEGRAVLAFRNGEDIGDDARA